MMSGLQGAFFRPLSIAFLLAVGLSLLVAMSATPAMSVLMMARHHAEARGAASSALQARPAAHDRLAARASPRADRHRRATGIAGIVFLPLLGARLLPDFRENYLIAHASLRPASRSPRPRGWASRSPRASSPFPASRASPSRSVARRTARTPTRPTRASSRCRSIRRSGATPRRSMPRIRDVFDDYPNQLVEIYSVLAERIGETLSGESAPFSVSVIGSDLDADDRVGARDRRGAAASAAAAATCG